MHFPPAFGQKMSQHFSNCCTYCCVQTLNSSKKRCQYGVFMSHYMKTLIYFFEWHLFRSRFASKKQVLPISIVIIYGRFRRGVSVKQFLNQNVYAIGICTCVQNTQNVCFYTHVQSPTVMRVLLPCLSLKLTMRCYSIC